MNGTLKKGIKKCILNSELYLKQIIIKKNIAAKHEHF